MLKKTMSSVCCILMLAGMSLVLSGCVAKNAMSNTQTNRQTTEKEPTMYGPPQIIYRIDNNRYFTLENYTRCENGQTFYNNKAKGIHVKILEGSGYLFKGRLFWASKSDDNLAFPATFDTHHDSCMGSDKGCVNAIIVTTDGGDTVTGVPYGNNTQDPTGITKNYDIYVTDKGFYVIYYRGKNRVYPVIDRWDFAADNVNGVVSSEHAYDLFKPGEQVPVGGFYKIDLSKFYPKNGELKMHCDRTLEPVQSLEGEIQ